MVTATLANCNFASPAMFTVIAGVRNEPTEAASHEKEGAGAVEVRYWPLDGVIGRRFCG